MGVELRLGQSDHADLDTALDQILLDFGIGLLCDEHIDSRVARGKTFEQRRQELQ
ncbi:hypothetical protein D3C87_2146660 [compost metagenome]